MEKEGTNIIKIGIKNNYLPTDTEEISRKIVDTI